MFRPRRRPRSTFRREPIPREAAAARLFQVMGDRTIGLWSLGKVHGLPLARLALVAANSELVARRRRGTTDWPVGADAIAMGIDF